MMGSLRPFYTCVGAGFKPAPTIDTIHRYNPQMAFFKKTELIQKIELL